jgi:hypothetical protein
MKTTVAAVLGIFAIIGSVYGAKMILDSEHKLLIAQSAESIQAGVSANQLQMMRWELNDINARIKAGKTEVGDEARKVELEARIKKLAGK